MHQSRSFAALFASTLLAACTHAMELTSTESELVGGTGTFDYPAVLYLDESCTGTLIAPNVVLTAAHCQIQAGAMAESIELDEVLSSHRVEEVVFHRRHTGGDAFTSHDLSLVRLADSPDAAPMPVQLTPLPELGEDEFLRVIGFGVTDGSSNFGAGTKRLADIPVHGLTEEFIQGGDSNKSICYGDSGGPGILMQEGVETVIGVTRSHFDNCKAESQWTRTDTYADEFIIPYVDAWSGPCALDGECVTNGCRTPDPDCAPCGIDGVCSEGCERADLDCPLGTLDGEACATNDDCESRVCVDEPGGEGRYCAGRCSDVDKSCAPGLLCEPTDSGFLCLRQMAENEEPKSSGCAASRPPGSLWIALLAIALVGCRRSRREVQGSGGIAPSGRR